MSSVTISDVNAALNGAKTITVTATDAAGNSGTGTASVELANKLSFTSTIPAGTSLFHVPLDVEGLDTVGDLKRMLGDAVSVITVRTPPGSEAEWDSSSGNEDVMITADLGIILSMTAEVSLTFEGTAWGGGISMISLNAGRNLVGLPVDDPGVNNVTTSSRLLPVLSQISLFPLTMDLQRSSPLATQPMVLSWVMQHIS